MKELDVFTKCNVKNFEPSTSLCFGGFWTGYGLEQLKHLTYFMFKYEENDSMIYIRVFRTSDLLFQKSLISQKGFCDCGYSTAKEWKSDDHFVLVNSKSKKCGAYELTEKEFTNVMYDVTKVFKKYMAENPENTIDKKHYNIKFRTDKDELYDDGWNFLNIGSEFIKEIEEIIDRFPMRNTASKSSEVYIMDVAYVDDLDLPKVLRRCE